MSTRTRLVRIDLGRGEMVRYLQMSSLLVSSVVFWEAFVQITQINKVILPAPSYIVFVIIAEQLNFYLFHTAITLLEVVIGLIVGSLLGFLSAVGIYYIGFLRRAFYPLLTTVYVVPKVAFAPLLIIWFGPTLVAKALFSMLVVFFPVLVNVYSGLRGIEPELLDLARPYQVSEWYLFWHIRIPAALPMLVTALKLGITYSVIGAIIAEFLGSEFGLGFVIIGASRAGRTPELFGAVVFTGALGLSLYTIAVFLDRRLLFWYRT